MEDLKKSCIVPWHIIAYALFLVCTPSQGQDLFSDDTIKIKEVVISSRHIDSELPGFRKTNIDSTLLRNYNHISLAELLTASSPVFIKSYGSGGSATSSLRGTGASHTQVSWNGINISNPMLGQADFSLITPGLLDNIQLSMGGASMDIGGGGIGGIINLENKPSWGKQTMGSINPGIGSFGNFILQAGIKTGNDNLLSVTKINLDYSENDYPYLNTITGSEPVREKRTNSQISRKDFLQELYFRKDKNVLSARIWYQSADRNLPGSMLIQSGTSGEKQNDESFRTLFSFDTEKGKTNFFVKGSWILNRLDYHNQLASIESLNRSNSFILKLGFEVRILKGTELKVFFNEELNAINSNNYEKNVAGNTAYLTVLAERRSGSRLGTTLLMRETLDNTRLMVPDFSAGLEFRLFPGEDHFLRSGFSRTSRLPSMNERYWYPGGNRDLKNEFAYLFDFGYKMNQRISASMSLDSEIGFYRNLIRDMIQWHPGEFAYWIADNINRVNTTGFEASLSLRYSHDNMTVNLNAGYSCTRALSAGTGTEAATVNQLMYIPENQANGSLFAGYRKFYLMWITTFTGKRFITVDNSAHLPSCSITNFVSGLKIPFGMNLFDLSFRIDNIFDLSYQTIAFHPQPGRSYHASVLYQLSKKVRK